MAKNTYPKIRTFLPLTQFFAELETAQPEAAKQDEAQNIPEIAPELAQEPSEAVEGEIPEETAEKATGAKKRAKTKTQDADVNA